MNDERDKRRKAEQRKVRNVKQKEGVIMPAPVSKADLPDGYANLLNIGLIGQLCKRCLHKLLGITIWL